MTKELILSRGKVALVDDEDYEWANQWKWSVKVAPRTFYAERRGPVPQRANIRLHRELVGAVFGVEVDHINGNGLDNRRDNLRLATRQENGCNRSMQKNNTSGCKGVTWHKKMGKWRSRIMINKKRVSLGCFSDLEEAARAYDTAALEHHGEFARLNFP